MWEEWLNVLLGVWLILSPWLLGFSGVGNAMWNALIVGVLVGALALSLTWEKPKAA
nr:SPW repeat protein [Thermus igniterrae]